MEPTNIEDVLSTNVNNLSLGTADKKVLKQSANLIQLQQQNQPQPSFGICFDVDGVLARGLTPIPAAIRAFRRLVDERGQTRFPVAFVTNSLSCNADKARELSSMLGAQIGADQVVQAQGPLVMFSKLHDKFCLVVGQGKILQIAHDLGFKNVCTLEDIAEAYPLLDMVDHDNRQRIELHGYTEKDFPKIEAIVLLGEPKRWETALQILVDILRTNGFLTRSSQSSSNTESDEQLPVVACNMDLEFMHRASIPRYGHGAFLICLESLYQKVTGRELKYTALIGKPSEITFRYAEHVLTSLSRKLSYTEPLKTMYLIGDTPDSDIVGSNLYQRYVSDRLRRETAPLTTDIDNVISDDVINTTTLPVKADPATACSTQLGYDPEIPPSRNVPLDAKIYRATVEKVVPLLVCTGVFQLPPGRRSSDSNFDSGLDTGSSNSDEEEESKQFPYHGHRDFPNSTELFKPFRVRDDVSSAVEYILQREQCA